MHKIKAIMFYVVNTSVGPNNILPLVIKKVWLIYKEKVTCLFQRCQEKGYH